METTTKFKTALGLNGFGWANVITEFPYDFDAILKHAARLGFDGIELFGLPDEYPATISDRLALRKQIEDHGLRVASIQSLPGGLGNGHPGSAYSLCRRQYVDYIKGMLEMAATMESDSLGVWAGELFGSGPSDAAVGHMVDVYGQCAELAAEAGIPLCLEAEPVQQVNTPDVWFKILRGVNSPYLKAICDFAHVNVFVGGHPHELIQELLPFIGHTHLCGNDGTCTDCESHSSTHLTFGEGSMDWQAMLNQLLDGGYTGWLDVDLWEHPDPMAGAEAGKHVISAVPCAWGSVEQIELLLEPLRHNSGHRGSHCFLTHEFIDALVHDRDPVIDVYESIAYTVPGIIAHASALQGGRLLNIPQYDPK